MWQALQGIEHGLFQTTSAGASETVTNQTTQTILGGFLK